MVSVKHIKAVMNQGDCFADAALGGGGAPRFEEAPDENAERFRGFRRRSAPATPSTANDLEKLDRLDRTPKNEKGCQQETGTAWGIILANDVTNVR